MQEKPALRPTDRAHPSALAEGGFLAARYRIHQVVSESASAIVYRASGAHGGDFVVKELFPQRLVTRAAKDPTVMPVDATAAAQLAEARRRFLLDAQILVALRNPHLPVVIDQFEANGTAYLVMEALGGRTLAEAWPDGRMPAPEACRLVLELLGALEALHGQGIIHRDVAPENVLLDAAGGVRLLGLATPRQLLFAGREPEMLRRGYAAVELYGSRSKGPWTDVHAVAVLLYWLLTGAVPPSALDRAAGENLLHPTRLEPGMARGIADVVMRGLALRPEERPFSAEQYRALLERAMLQTPPGQLPGLDAPARGGMSAAATLLPGESLSAVLARAGLDPEAVDPKAVDAGPRGFSLVRGPGGAAVLSVPSAEPEPSPTRSFRPGARVWRVGGGIAVVAVLAGVGTWALLRTTGGRATGEVRRAPAAAPAPRAVTPAPVPAAPATVAESDSAVAAVAQVPATEPPPSAQPAPASSRVEMATPPAPRPAQTRTVEPPRPTGRAAAAARTGAAADTVPPEVLAQIQSALASAKERAARYDFGGAHRLFRLTRARLTDAIATYRGSPTLVALRRDVDQEWERAREACDAANVIAARRGAPAISCD